MAGAQLHEPREKLSNRTLDIHRAISSLREELEAVDWYMQRIEGCTDAELKDILTHNRDEEKEHAAMLIEWLRRNDEGFAGQLKEYLFSDNAIASD